MRFALAWPDSERRPVLGSVREFAALRFGSLGQAACHYLAQIEAPTPRRSVIAVASAITGDQIKITWSEMENGKALDITLSGTVKGDEMSGTARLGTVGEGPFSADRTAS